MYVFIFLFKIFLFEQAYSITFMESAWFDLTVDYPQFHDYVSLPCLKVGKNKL